MRSRDIPRLDGSDTVYHDDYYSYYQLQLYGRYLWYLSDASQAGSGNRCFFFSRISFLMERHTIGGTPENGWTWRITPSVQTSPNGEWHNDIPSSQRLVVCVALTIRIEYEHLWHWKGKGLNKGIWTYSLRYIVLVMMRFGKPAMLPGTRL